MAIVAGKPDESEMIFRIHSDDEDEIMPPPEIGKPLTLKEKKVLEQWISEGAVWADHWAYVESGQKPPAKVKISLGKALDRSFFPFPLLNGKVKPCSRRRSRNLIRTPTL